jgi:hypothetical protein
MCRWFNNKLHGKLLILFIILFRSCIATDESNFNRIIVRIFFLKSI